MKQQKINSLSLFLPENISQNKITPELQKAKSLIKNRMKALDKNCATENNIMNKILSAYPSGEIKIDIYNVLSPKYFLPPNQINLSGIFNNDVQNASDSDLKNLEIKVLEIIKNVFESQVDNWDTLTKDIIYSEDGVFPEKIISWEFILKIIQKKDPEILKKILTPAGLERIYIYNVRDEVNSMLKDFYLQNKKNDQIEQIVSKNDFYKALEMLKKNNLTLTQTQPLVKIITTQKTNTNLSILPQDVIKILQTNNEYAPDDKDSLISIIKKEDTRYTYQILEDEKIQLSENQKDSLIFSIIEDVKVKDESDYIKDFYAKEILENEKIQLSENQKDSLISRIIKSKYPSYTYEILQNEKIQLSENQKDSLISKIIESNNVSYTKGIVENEKIQLSESQKDSLISKIKESNNKF